MKKKALLSAFVAAVLSFTACDSNDDNKSSINVNSPSPKEQWGATWLGTDTTMNAYPDFFANYWEYTFSHSDNPNVYLKITGKYPRTRFFNFTIYNDATQINESGIEDRYMIPDEGSVNPYTSDVPFGDNKFTVYVIPTNAPQSLRDELTGKNICEFDSSIDKVAIFLRQYIGTKDDEVTLDEFGGVELPKIKAFDMSTNKEVDFPTRQGSGLAVPDLIPPQSFRDLGTMVFMRAPFTTMYPNIAAQYLFNTFKLETGKVAVIRFKPTPIAANRVEYPTADLRYWSMCIGDYNTHSWFSMHDKQTTVDEDGMVNFVIVDSNSSNFTVLQQKIESRKGTYLAKWDINNHGDKMLIIYRNAVLNTNYKYCIDKVATSNDANASQMQKIAHLVIGEYGPVGKSMTEADFMDVTFNFKSVRPDGK